LQPRRRSPAQDSGARRSPRDCGDAAHDVRLLGWRQSSRGSRASICRHSMLLKVGCCVIGDLRHVALRVPDLFGQQRDSNGLEILTESRRSSPT
jgi:hypothetical protein